MSGRTGSGGRKDRGGGANSAGGPGSGACGGAGRRYRSCDRSIATSPSFGVGGTAAPPGGARPDEGTARRGARSALPSGTDLSGQRIGHATTNVGGPGAGDAVPRLDGCAKRTRTASPAVQTSVFVVTMLVAGGPGQPGCSPAVDRKIRCGTSARRWLFWGVDGWTRGSAVRKLVEVLGSDRAWPAMIRGPGLWGSARRAIFTADRTPGCRRILTPAPPFRPSQPRLNLNPAWCENPAGHVSDAVDHHGTEDVGLQLEYSQPSPRNASPHHR
jgi:hypothetical protein